MKLITVRCWRPEDRDEDKHRLGVAIASSPDEAKDLCRAAYKEAGYNRFELQQIVEGHFDGPAREIGFAGAEAFSWKS